MEMITNGKIILPNLNNFAKSKLFFQIKNEMIIKIKVILPTQNYFAKSK